MDPAIPTPSPVPAPDPNPGHVPTGVPGDVTRAHVHVLGHGPIAGALVPAQTAASIAAGGATAAPPCPTADAMLETGRILNLAVVWESLV